jgi:peptidoglycan/xylan/chitin deacetylase (PgdA/CDA1 family)
MKKDVILTFDYEVFLGSQTGTITNSVIRPTQYVLEILKRYNSKAIFFVDAAWLLFLKENLAADFNIVAEQLKDIIKTGSSVELHLHPQWMDAHKTSDGIAFTSFNHYRLHSLKDSEILNLFKSSVELLENITNQKVTCYRAGGFCIEPFDRIKNAFEAVGIRYDFSVAPQMQLKEGRDYDYDFSDAPMIPFYHFNHDVKKPDTNGPFIEIPLSMYLNNPFYRLTNKILLRIKNDKEYGDGIGIRQNSFFFFRSLNRRLKFSKDMLSLDKSNNWFFKYLINIHFRNSKFIVIISHPKMMSKEGLSNLIYVAKNFRTIGSGELESYLNLGPKVYS